MRTNWKQTITIKLTITYMALSLQSKQCIIKFITVKKFLSVWLFVVSTWSFGFFITTTTANDLRLWRIFYPSFCPLHLFSYLNSWERASIFPFECSVQNKGTTGTIFITSLVLRGPWLGIEPGTFGTRSQHYTTRLSRRRNYSINLQLRSHDFDTIWY